MQVLVEQVSRRSAQEKLAHRRRMKLAELRQALLDSGADAAVIDEIVAERQPVDIREAESSLELKFDWMPRTHRLSSKKIAFDLAMANAPDENSKLRLTQRTTLIVLKLRHF